MRLPILPRGKRFGYVFWRAQEDAIMRSLLGEREDVFVVFKAKNVGIRNIDWKYRRISVGYARTRGLDEQVKTFVLSMNKSSLKVDVE